MPERWKLMWSSRSIRLFLLSIAIGMLAGVALAVESANGLNLKPGFNIYSRDQDIQLGKQEAAEIENEVPLLHDAETLHYLNGLLRRLLPYEPLPADYPFEIRVLNDREINAFALPGGIIYVNRGTIESAEDEAQLAGAVAHETGHVVMRHGTHQATEVVLAQFPLAIIDGWLGQSSGTMGDLAQAGLGFGVNSLLLRNTRANESQADTIGTYVLYHAGYDPHALARFFEIIKKKDPTRTIQFFSDHPNPENRIQAIEAEIPQLGSPVSGRTDTAEFQTIKKRLLGLPSPPKKPKAEE